MADDRSTCRDLAAHGVRAETNLDIRSTNGYTDTRLHTDGDATTDTHGDVFSNAHSPANCDLNRLADIDRDAVADCHPTATTIRHAHAHANALPIYASNTYPHFNADAYFIVHANGNVHT